MDQTPVIEQQKVPDPKISYLRRVLATIFFAGLTLAIALAGNIAWENYNLWVQKRLLAQIEPTTLWVKEEIPLYLILYNKIVRINLNGLGLQDVYQTDDLIDEYYFSPDGKHLVVNMTRKLVLVDFISGKDEIVEELVFNSPDLKGALSRLTWDRESKKFFYMRSLWSPVSSYEEYFVYTIAAHKNVGLKGPSYRLMDVYWDWEGKNLYYARPTQKDKFDPYKFSFKIFRIPMDTFKPQLVDTLSTDKGQLPTMDLRSLEIKLFVPQAPLAFKKKESHHLSAVSTKGMEIRLNKDDYLYYGEKGSPLKKLIRLPRLYLKKETPLKHLEWASGGRYVLLVHRSLGILVFDPLTRKIGRLIDLKAEGLGWNPAGRDPRRSARKISSAKITDGRPTAVKLKWNVMIDAAKRE